LALFYEARSHAAFGEGFTLARRLWRVHSFLSPLARSNTHPNIAKVDQKDQNAPKAKR
jgi:hypothetical protein